jgi:hypothetical protein
VNGSNRFSAHAFSSVGIQGPDSSVVVRRDDLPSLPRTVYVVAFGANNYLDKTLQLKYAVADATDFVSELSSDQSKLPDFAKVVSLDVPDPTKDKIVQTLKDLKTQPQDRIFLLFSGHGVSFARHFYYLPVDFDASKSPEEAGSNAVSDQDLESLLEDISAQDVVLIVDACESGSMLELGNRWNLAAQNYGLAQLAFEKGISVLDASQANEYAKESAALGGGHGYLTFALIDQALKKRLASEKGAALELEPWMQFAMDTVQSLQSKADSAKDNSRPLLSRPLAGAPSGRVDAIQVPRMFYRRPPGNTAFIIAKF